jgi:hypothetical protein
MGTLVEMHDDLFGLDLDDTTGLYEFAVQLFRRCLVEAAQLLRQPAVKPSSMRLRRA